MKTEDLHKCFLNKAFGKSGPIKPSKGLLPGYRSLAPREVATVADRGLYCTIIGRFTSLHTHPHILATKCWIDVKGLVPNCLHKVRFPYHGPWRTPSCQVQPTSPNLFLKEPHGGLPTGNLTKTSSHLTYTKHSPIVFLIHSIGLLFASLDSNLTLFLMKH